ncbi:MAG: histidine kinase N-terminal 7TM domain-containing protein, partial [Patescibacteria group bacterium]
MSVSSIFDLNNYFFNVYAIPNFAIAVILLALGIFVWSRDFRAKLNVSFFLFTIFAVGWFFSYAVVYFSNKPDVAFFWNRIVYLFVPFLAPSIFFYTSVLIGR